MNKSKVAVLVMVGVVVGLPVLAGFGLVAWLWVKVTLDSWKKPEIEQMLSRAEAKAAEMDARWQRAMAASSTL